MMDFVHREYVLGVIQGGLWEKTLAAVALFATIGAGITVYHLVFHPLAGFPGPKIAAATGWYEFWYDVVKKGQYVYVIEQMHNKYGPIVRLSPNELSIRDPDYYNEVYVAGNTRRTNIWPRYRRGIGFDGSHTMSEVHELHRARRKPLEPFFSRLGIERIESTIAEEAKLLDERFQELKGSGTVVRLDHVFSSYAGDVIGKVCCETPTAFMKHPDFSPDWHNLIESVVGQILLFMHIPFLVSLVRLLPLRVLLNTFSGGVGFASYRKVAMNHIIEAKEEKRVNEKVMDDPKSSIFRYILCSDLPEEEQSVERLSREAMVLLGAGTATTARTMGFICYFALAKPHIKNRLREELADVMSTFPEQMPTWSQIEKVRYLHACIKEGLRLSYGVMRRLPRCSPDVALQYKEWTIPKGTPVGMSAYYMHTDPEVYPEPFEFVPERWLGEYDPKMDRNWVPFTKGSRNCLGINLAHAEMNIALATLFRPGAPEMKLYETTKHDVMNVVDFLMPVPALDSRGTRITIE